MRSVNYILVINKIRHVAVVEMPGAVITACPTLGGRYFRVESGRITRSSDTFSDCL